MHRSSHRCRFRSSSLHTPRPPQQNHTPRARTRLHPRARTLYHRRAAGVSRRRRGNRRRRINGPSSPARGGEPARVDERLALTPPPPGAREGHGDLEESLSVLVATTRKGMPISSSRPIASASDACGCPFPAPRAPSLAPPAGDGARGAPGRERARAQRDLEARVHEQHDELELHPPLPPSALSGARLAKRAWRCSERTRHGRGQQRTRR